MSVMLGRNICQSVSVHISASLYELYYCTFFCFLTLHDSWTATQPPIENVFIQSQGCIGFDDQSASFLVVKPPAGCPEKPPEKDKEDKWEVTVSLTAVKKIRVDAAITAVLAKNHQKWVKGTSLKAFLGQLAFTLSPTGFVKSLV